MILTRPLSMPATSGTELFDDPACGMWRYESSVYSRSMISYFGAASVECDRRALIDGHTPSTRA